MRVSALQRKVAYLALKAKWKWNEALLGTPLNMFVCLFACWLACLLACLFVCLFVGWFVCVKYALFPTSLYHAKCFNVLWLKHYTLVSAEGRKDFELVGLV